VVTIKALLRQPIATKAATEVKNGLWHYYPWQWILPNEQVTFCAVTNVVP
jgi:phage pi2 protein 07